jgi:two-component system, NtrC family, sensor kinase
VRVLLAGWEPGLRGLAAMGALALALALALVGLELVLRSAPRLLVGMALGWALAASVLALVAWSAGRRTRRSLLASLREQRRRHLEQAAAERMASLGTLAAGLAHEVNNPLTYVLSNLRTLSAELPELRQALGSPQGGSAWDSERMEDLVDCAREALEGAERVRIVIHAFRACTTGAQEPYGLVELNALVESALRLASAELYPRAHVSRHLGELPPLHGYATRLVQVFVHLLSNAAHAIEPGAPERNSVCVRTWAEAGEVHMEVRDTGRGIPPADLARIFEPFFTTRGVGQGLGLGLWLCHNVVRAHNGRISVDSTPGQGSRFTVHLPLEPHPAP